MCFLPLLRAECMCVVTVSTVTTVSKISLIFRHLPKDEKILFNTLHNTVTSQYLFLYSNLNFIISWAGHKQRRDRLNLPLSYVSSITNTKF